MDGGGRDDARRRHAAGDALGQVARDDKAQAGRVQFTATGHGSSGHGQGDRASSHGAGQGAVGPATAATLAAREGRPRLPVGKNQWSGALRVQVEKIRQSGSSEPYPAGWERVTSHG